MHDARRLLRILDDEMFEHARWTGRSALSARVRHALASVPREKFVLPPDRALAYANRPLSIGHGQTISQPFIVALMTELLDSGPEQVCLEVGTGCGYQAAVLSHVFGSVHTLEIVPELAASARARLRALGYANVHVHCADGYAGWPDAAPYDAVIVTAAAPEVPRALLEQLVPGGRMAIPLGEPYAPQVLALVTHGPDGQAAVEEILPVAFVPMVPDDVPDDVSGDTRDDNP